MLQINGQMRVETLDELKNEMSIEIIDVFFDRIYPKEEENIKKCQAGVIDAVPYEGSITEWCDLHHCNIYKIDSKTREITFVVNGEMYKYPSYHDM